MFKVTYRVGLLVSERKVGPVLRHLLELAKFVQVVAPPNDLATEAGKLRLLTVFEHAPTQSEIAKLERAGAVLPERTRAGLEAVWRGAVRSTEDEVELLMEAGAVKRRAVSRARRTSRG